MPNLLTLTQLREMVQSTVEGVAAWCAGKPRLFELARPEQQIQFELASRLREAIRERAANPAWDRLQYDASEGSRAGGHGSRAPIFVDTRQLFGAVSAPQRNPTEPDTALAVHVLRTSRSPLEIDENGLPVGQAYLPLDLHAEGAAMEDRVRDFERLSHSCCDGALVVVYSNAARRRTAVDSREIASWASWQTPLDTLWWTVRHFRAKAR